jgi:FtsH-binding integral membrane protein
VSSSTAVAVAARAPINQERMERVFYLLAGCLLLVIVAMGFQQFYLHGRANNGGPVTQQIVPLVFLHGILMSAWIIFFVAQSSLIVSGNRKLHMSLGVAGMVLAAFLVVLGVTTAIASVHYNPDGYKDIWGARRFLSLMLTNVLGFGMLAAIGLKNRRRPELHRPMMLFGHSVCGWPCWPFPYSIYLQPDYGGDPHDLRDLGTDADPWRLPCPDQAIDD